MTTDEHSMQGGKLPAPVCPICGRLMMETGRFTPPSMGGTPRRIDWRWICSQSDDRGEGHIVELRKPHREKP